MKNVAETIKILSINLLHIILLLKTDTQLALDFKEESMAHFSLEVNKRKNRSIPLTRSETMSVQQKLTFLKPLLEQLEQVSSIEEKLSILDRLPIVEEFVTHSEGCTDLLKKGSLEEQYLIKSLVVLGQGPIVFQKIQKTEECISHWPSLLVTLSEVEKLYETIGGIIGYHVAVLNLIINKHEEPQWKEPSQYLQPEGLDLSKGDKKVYEAVRWGIENMPLLAEIYPVGGAGDRLNLVEQVSGDPLPAALLQFGGRSLLEGLIRDVQGREYLYHKLYGKQLTIPIAMMTSHEKDNDKHIRGLCEDHDWFGRSPDSFIFFTQPLVPVITQEGDWAVLAPFKLSLKPGGHGLLWKLAHENGVFEHFKKSGRTKALVRQINNPVAGTDHALLAFTGIGCKKNRAFGFASCPRVLKASEGMDVIVEKKTGEGFEYCLTNIEYTDFKQKGIQDIPKEAESRYSAFPSNTNILFADLAVVEEAAKVCPIPGLLINMKTKFHCLDSEGHPKDIEAGRLESTMQNIADYIVDKFPQKVQRENLDRLSSFITFNERRKTISVTKSSYEPGKDILGTPEGCFYEMSQNHEELLGRHCGMNIPPIGTQQEFIDRGPPFIFWYHPALGPLYEVVGQKIRGGKLEKGSELQLEIAELDMENVLVQGSLIVKAEFILGAPEASGQIIYGDKVGRCTLRNVKVVNKGINHKEANTYWKNLVEREEELRIVLQGNSEFFAENVCFKGGQTIHVPDGYRCTAIQRENSVELQLEKQQPKKSWTWVYNYNNNNKIKLKKTNEPNFS